MTNLSKLKAQIASYMSNSIQIKESFELREKCVYCGWQQKKKLRQWFHKGEKRNPSVTAELLHNLFIPLYQSEQFCAYCFPFWKERISVLKCINRSWIAPKISRGEQSVKYIITYKPEASLRLQTSKEKQRRVYQTPTVQTPRSNQVAEKVR